MIKKIENLHEMEDYYPIVFDKLNELINTVNLLAEAVNPMIEQKLREQEMSTKIMMSQGRDECIQGR